MSIKSRIKKLKEEKYRIESEIINLQESCKHNNVHMKYGSYTGNPYDRDTYWIDYSCPDCQKRWRVDR